MSKYTCDTCFKTFSQKGHYDAHKKRKRPCKKDNTIELLVEQKVKEVLSKKNEEVVNIQPSVEHQILANQIDYSKKTREELIAICKEKNIKGYSGKKKGEIVDLLTPKTKKDKHIKETITQINDKKTIAKPFLKWVGGKTQIIDSVLAEFPNEMNNYYEPFLGGGSVLLGLLSRRKAGTIKISGTVYASDVNSNLIALYKTIQTDPTTFIREVKSLTIEFEKCKFISREEQKKDKANEKRRKDLEPSTLEEAKTNQESYYYWIRKSYKMLSNEEKQSAKGSAMFLFLNKTCFRGVYREGPDGFNVPYGYNKNVGIVDENHIQTISELIQGVIFRVCSFQDTLAPVQKGDFVYLDPPYAPETETSFVGYTTDGFSLENHKQLFEITKGLHTKGAKFLMSNADVKLVKDSFPEAVYHTKKILCRRAINSKNPESTTNEVLITN